MMNKTGKDNPAFKHGKWKSKEWIAWDHMKRRCNNPQEKSYKNYGAKGITVCERWMLFENFLADVGEAPSKAHSLDRINNNGNYEPGNIRWATKQEQQRNTSKNVLITHKGKTQTALEWSKEVDVSLKCIYNRIKKGWSHERTLTEPARSRSSV